MRILNCIVLITGLFLQRPSSLDAEEIRSLALLETEGECSGFLALSANSKRLRVGILFETDKGNLILGLADRITEHFHILTRAMGFDAEMGRIRKIFWAGELLLVNDTPKTSIAKLMAYNNTSGTAYTLMRVLQSGEPEQILSGLREHTRTAFERLLNHLEFVELSNERLFQVFFSSLPSSITPERAAYDFSEKPHLGPVFPDGGETLSLESIGDQTHNLMNTLYELQVVGKLVKTRNQAYRFEEHDRKDRLILELQQLSWLAQIYLTRGRNFDSFEAVVELIPQWLTNREIGGSEGFSNEEAGGVLEDASIRLAQMLKEAIGEVEFYYVDQARG